MTYTDPATKHVPSVTGKPPASWGTAVRDSLEALIEPPSGRYEQRAAWSLADATWQEVTFPTVVWESLLFQQAGDAEYDIPIGYGGKYQVTCTVGFESNTSGVLRMLRLLRDGTEVTRVRGKNDTSSGSAASLTLSTIVDLAENQTLTMEAYQNTGGALNSMGYHGGNSVCELTLLRVSR